MTAFPIRLALCALLAAGAARAQDEAALVREGQALTQRFGAALKRELTTTMEAEGPAGAVAVCHSRAPAIADALSEASGWTVSRSSHRLRNPDNAPDAYTAAAIDAFLAAEAAGTPAADLVRTEITRERDRLVFRMVKAIPTAPLCLSCHGGAEVAPEVEAILGEHYPEDRARGFAEGEMRGVFTLVKPLN